MFGNVRNQIIGRNVMPGVIGGFGGGTFNTDGTQVTPVQRGNADPGTQQPHRKTSQRIAGYLADALAGLAGRAGPYAAMLGQEQQQAQEAAMQQRQRADAYADFVQREQYKRANPEPRTNDTVADFEFIASQLGPEWGQKFLRNRADPPRYVQGPDGQFYPVQTAEPQVLGSELPQGWQIEGGVASPGSPPFGVSGGRLDEITAMSESGGNPNAVSPMGARGLMQVMPATSRDPGFGVRPSNGSQQDDVRLGQDYRRAMQQRYGGDPAKMWAAYNWGPGNLDRAIQRYGENWLQHAPKETQDYVARNLRALRGR